jgi:hypothetical protein
MFRLSTWLFQSLTTNLKINCTSKYQLKLGKCFECFKLEMKVYVGMQWCIGILDARRHEHMAYIKNANKKWHVATLGSRVNEMITITCYTHHAWHK